MTRILAVSSGKGGVGKTHLCVNLALHAARQGLRTCLFDADLGLANVNLLLKLHPKHTLGDVIAGTCSLRDIVIRGAYPMDIIPGSSGVAEMANLPIAALQRLGEEFLDLDQYDLIIFDTSSGIGQGVLGFVAAAPESLLVVTPEPTALTDAYAMVKLLYRNGYNGTLQVVVNQAQSERQARHTYEKFRAVVRVYQSVELPLLGWVPFDAQVSAAVRQQSPVTLVAPDCAASRAIHDLAECWLARAPTIDFDLAGFWTSLTGVRPAVPGMAPTAMQPVSTNTSDQQADMLARLTRLETGMNALLQELRASRPTAAPSTAPMAKSVPVITARKQRLGREDVQTPAADPCSGTRPVGRRAGEEQGSARFVRNARRAAPIDSLQLRRVVGRMLIKAGSVQREPVCVDVEHVQIKAENAYSLRPGRYTQVALQCRQVGTADEFIEEIFTNCAITGCKVRQLGSMVRFWLTTGHDGCIVLDGDAQQSSCVRVLLAAGENGLLEELSEPETGRAPDRLPRLRAVSRSTRVTPAQLLEKYPHQRLDGGRVDGEPLSIYRFLRRDRGPLVCAFHDNGTGDKVTGPVRESTT